MDYFHALEWAANAAEVATPIVGVTLWCIYRCEFSRKVKKLEEHLKEELPRDGGQRTILHITAQTGLTESEIIQASFKSRFIKRHQMMGKNGETERIKFSYNPAGESK